ncbi:sce7726 family protein [Intestinibacter bartlettii]|uniref:sce7726 family protein n=1 Tax=Intestinibacter bartlettii TaxID=261299 RepID=UPI000820BFAE|nr:sce7726 family protein [Intestinibacter bartlettii]SCI39701.1 Uncharacterised protein [uncultured Clostridium sp.]
MNNNYALNRFFSKNNFKELLNNNTSKIYSYLVKDILNNAESRPNSLVITDIYKFMNKNHRNEYYYKNTLLNKLLLGRHSLNTTTALTELPIGKSKADFVLINGKGVVYEIKTELDTFNRLESQINDYYKAFNHVCVITCESNKDKIKHFLNNSNVGICILNKNNKISTIREPIECNDFLNHETIFKILRKKEYEDIILKYYNELPNTTQFKYYDECFNLFKQIDIDIMYGEILKILKKRANVESKYFKSVPYELKFLVYFSQYKNKDYLKLNTFLNNNFEG